jgi:PAS domain S-box-containing protein
MASLPTIEEAEKLLEGLAGISPGQSPDSLSPLLPSVLSPQHQNHDNLPDYESRYKALMDHLPAVVFVASLEAAKVEAYVSPQIETILGFTQEEWLEDPVRWYSQVHPEDKQRWSTEAASLFLSGEPLSSTYRMLARDGRVVWFQCDARMIHGGKDKPSFIHGVGFDVTKLKETEASLKREQTELESRVEERTRDLARINERLMAEIVERKRTESLLTAAKEAAEAAARVKSEFMANMSHEIRTPMNGVLGLTALALNTELNPEQRQYLSIAHSSAESLLSIINQLLDFSKAENGKMKLQLADFSLRTRVTTLLTALTFQASRKGLSLLSEISPEVPENLIGDWGRLSQVLTNLVGNAIKFTKSGGMTLTIGLGQTVHPLPTSSCVLEFAVKDTGIGIPPAKLASIFDPFVQADGSVTREYGGTGLGLAITKDLVFMMGGQIHVTSKPDFGSVFSFTASLGCAPGSASLPSIPLKQGDPPATRNAHSLRVLLVEDNPVNRLVATKVLERYGYNVTAAANGLEALTAYGDSHFEVVLMDIQMPLMDGLSASRAIRAIETEQGRPRLPIIALTAHALPADRVRCAEAGMDGFLSKPFKSADLISLIEELIQSNTQNCPACVP